MTIFHIIKYPIQPVSFGCVFSETTWNSIPDKLKEIIRDKATELNKPYHGSYEEKLELACKEIRKFFLELDDDDIPCD